MTYIEYIKLKIEFPDYDEKYRDVKHLDYKIERRMEIVTDKMKNNK